MQKRTEWMKQKYNNEKQKITERIITQFKLRTLKRQIVLFLYYLFQFRTFKAQSHFLFYKISTGKKQQKMTMNYTDDKIQTINMRYTPARACACVCVCPYHFSISIGKYFFTYEIFRNIVNDSHWSWKMLHFRNSSGFMFVCIFETKYRKRPDAI